MTAEYPLLCKAFPVNQEEKSNWLSKQIKWMGWKGNIVLGRMIPVVPSRSKSLGSLVFFPGFSNCGHHQRPKRNPEKWKEQRRGLLISFPWSFSFTRVRWCLRKRASMEVRGGGCEWKGGGCVGAGPEGCPPAISPPFHCLSFLLAWQEESVLRVRRRTPG